MSNEEQLANEYADFQEFHEAIEAERSKSFATLLRETIQQNPDLQRALEREGKELGAIVSNIERRTHRFEFRPIGTTYAPDEPTVDELEIVWKRLAALSLRIDLRPRIDQYGLSFDVRINSEPESCVAAADLLKYLQNFIQSVNESAAKFQADFLAKSEQKPW